MSEEEVSESEPLAESRYTQEPGRPQQSADEPETPRENRKGWWQRRFKA
jgi:hypothetical protein